MHFTTRNLAILLGLLTAGSCSRQKSSNLRDQSLPATQSSEDTSAVGLVFSSIAALPVCSMDRKGMVIFVPAQSGVAAKECNGLGTWNTQLNSTRVTIPGSVGAVKTSTIPSADLARCPNGRGGLLISTWDDMNFDDTYTAGIDKDFAERPVCNGDKGDSGANSLVNNQQD